MVWRRCVILVVDTTFRFQFFCGITTHISVCFPHKAILWIGSLFTSSITRVLWRPDWVMLLWVWWTWLWPVLRVTPPHPSPRPRWGRSTWAARTCLRLCGTKNGPRTTTATDRFQDASWQLYCFQYVIRTLQWSTSMENKYQRVVLEVWFCIMHKLQIHDQPFPLTNTHTRSTCVCALNSPLWCT